VKNGLTKECTVKVTASIWLNLYKAREKQDFPLAENNKNKTATKKTNPKHPLQLGDRCGVESCWDV